MDRFRHDVGGVVAQQVERVGIPGRDEGDGRIRRQRRRQIAHPAVDADGDRFLRPAAAQALRHVGGGHRPIEGEPATVRQEDGEAAGGVGLRFGAGVGADGLYGGGMGHGHVCNRLVH